VESFAIDTLLKELHKQSDKDSLWLNNPPKGASIHALKRTLDIFQWQIFQPREYRTNQSPHIDTPNTTYSA
jgi:hypothetical protein